MIRNGRSAHTVAHSVSRDLRISTSGLRRSPAKNRSGFKSRLSIPYRLLKKHLACKVRFAPRAKSSNDVVIIISQTLFLEMLLTPIPWNPNVYVHTFDTRCAAIFKQRNFDISIDLETQRYLAKMRCMYIHIQYVYETLYLQSKGVSNRNT